VAFSQRFRWRILLAVLVVTVAAGLMARRVRVNPRIEALLPDDTASAQSLDELKARLASSSPLFLLVRSDDLVTSRRLARELYSRVSRWPETQWAMYKRDPSVFADNRLLYLSAEDIEELDDQIDERERWESCAKIPGCNNLDPDPPPLPSDDDLRTLFEKNPDVRALLSLFGEDTRRFVEAEPTGGASKPEANGDVGRGEPSSEAELGELCAPENNVCAVHVQLDGDAGDLDFATSILERSEALFDEVGEGETANVQMAVSGQFRNLPITRRAVNADLAKISILSSSLMLLVLLFQFRGLFSIVGLLGPALLGIVWTAGVLGTVHPEINLISAFTLAVLAGVGIDFGVHLLTHYSEQRETTEDPTVALSHSLTSLLPSLLVAAFTTSAGFAALGVASFHGFSEMGPVAAGGIAISLMTFLVAFPAFVLAVDRGQRCPFRLRRYRVRPWRLARTPAVAITAAFAVLTIALGFVGRGVSFEYDFRNLRPSGVAHGIPWGGTTHGTSRNAVYLLADDPEALNTAVAGIRKERPTEIVEGDQPFILVPAAFIPPQQPERLEALSKLSKTLDRARRNASPSVLEKIDRFAPLARVTKPLTTADLPRWVSEWLFEKDGSFGTLGVLYTSLSGSDAKEMELLAHQMQAWRERYPHVRFASGVAQLGEVTPRLRSEAPTMLGLALLGVCLGTLLVSRSPRRLLLVLLPLAVMVCLSLGFMVLFDMRVNLYNMLVFPLAFGIGVDGAVYVTWALESDAPGRRLLTATRAVLGSTLTSVAGFGSLMVSDNPGVASIGALASLMLAIALAACLVCLPALHVARGKHL